MDTSIPEFQYLEEVIRTRLNEYFPSEAPSPPPVMPALADWKLPLGKFALENQLDGMAAMLLLIGLVPHVRPDLFDRAIESKIPGSGNFPRLGGIRGKNSRSFLPTGETALFLLGGDDLAQRLQVQKMFGVDHIFGQRKILWLEDMPSGEPVMSGRIIISQDYIDTFVEGRPAAPHFSSSFPARIIRDKRSWDSLVIGEELQTQINEIKNWLKFNSMLMDRWGMNDRLKKGYRALFFGPPGTGKTLTAALLGNEMKKDVYKIDLSMVVSKYIGETEKNLELLFARAEDKGWILFFDEADALFGKRTSVKDAHDKYANQEVSYLLQRIEDYNGLIILASNMKNNIDEAFIRRFNGILRFPFPEAVERSQIWRKSFPPDALFAKNPEGAGAGAPVAPGAGAGMGGAAGAGTLVAPGAVSRSVPGLREVLVDIPEEVKKYEMAGGSIINVVHYACLKAIERAHTRGDQSLIIFHSDVLYGIQIEMNKHGKPFVL